MSSGKAFEQDFKKSITDSDISVDRLYDSMGGFKGVTTICDFILYAYPHQYYLELKSYKGTYIPMSAIKKHQFTGLMQKRKVSGVRAGVLLNYRIDDELQETYYIDILAIDKLKQQDIKGINLDTARQNGVLVPAHRKRTRYSYDIRGTLSLIREA